jgi:hypothetical protein
MTATKNMSMARARLTRSVTRRTLLAGGSAGLASLVIRSLRAQAAGAPPKRLLIVHRPCGTVPELFFPTSTSADFELPPILTPLAPLRKEMVVLRNVTCPRDPAWIGDKPSAGLIAMMSGRKFGFRDNGSDNGDPNAKNIVAADKTIDQLLLESAPALQGLPSIQSTASSASIGGLPGSKVMSYTGFDQPLVPQRDVTALVQGFFGVAPFEGMRRADNEAVLDCISEDLTRLQDLAPASQKDKLAQHRQSLLALRSPDPGGNNPNAACEVPSLEPFPAPREGATPEEAEHFTVIQNQFAFIQAAFQCDFARVATFSFAPCYSDLRFTKIIDGLSHGDGHYTMSQDTSAKADLARIDQAYCEQLSLGLQRMKNTKEGNGTLLDNTLVVFLSECGISNTHSIEAVPVLLFGGKNLGLKTGQCLELDGRPMNDVWAAVCDAFGAEAKFGDPAFGTGPVSGLFG